MFISVFLNYNIINKFFYYLKELEYIYIYIKRIEGKEG